MIVEIELEEDGRWIAEVPDLPGVMTYGQSREEAISKAKALALRVLADRLEHGEEIPELSDGILDRFSRTILYWSTWELKNSFRLSQSLNMHFRF